MACDKLLGVSPKASVFCVLSEQKVYGPLFFAERTIAGENWIC
jgi:hypothetical protein